jgi:hypothetical protein
MLLFMLMKRSHWEQITEDFGFNFEFSNSLLKPETNLLDSLLRLQLYFERVNQKLHAAVNEYRATGSPRLLHIISGVNKRGIMPSEFSALLALFNYKGGTIYRIGQDFGLELDRVDINLAAKYLPLRGQIICLEFPSDMKFQTSPSEYANCVYIHLSDRISPEQSASGVELTGYLSAPIYKIETDELLTDAVVNMTFALYKDKTLEDSLAELDKNNRGGILSSHELIRYSLKCLLYISSGSPDLRHKMKEQPKGRKRKKVDVIQAKMVLVGFLYKKTKAEREKERLLDVRWASCQTNADKIELIWKEPERVKGRLHKTVIPHKVINGVEFKFCRDCESWLVLEDFYSSDTWDKLRVYCKKCEGRSTREYQKNNPKKYVKKTGINLLPQKRGRKEVPHQIINHKEHKLCRKCDSWRSLEKFSYSRRTLDKLQVYCKECQRLTRLKGISP